MLLIVEHLVRNSIEHGGRSPEIRLASGKPEYLSVRVTLQDNGDTWLLSVWDNGEGLDDEKLLDKALSLGLITPASVKLLTLDQRIKLIFIDGFSTRERKLSIVENDRTLAQIRAVLKTIDGVISVQNQMNASCEFTVNFPKF